FEVRSNEFEAGCTSIFVEHLHEFRPFADGFLYRPPTGGSTSFSRRGMPVPPTIRLSRLTEAVQTADMFSASFASAASHALLEPLPSLGSKFTNPPAPSVHAASSRHNRHTLVQPGPIHSTNDRK